MTTGSHHSRVAPFGGFGAPWSVYEAARIVILPVPFDRTSTWLKGCDKGPQAIIEASPNLEFYDIETDTEVYRQGIHTADPVIADNSLDMLQAVERRVAGCLADGKLVVTLGGEHSVTIGAVRAYAAHRPGLCVLHLDAHLDQRDEYDGTPYSHACTMARVAEATPHIVSVGIRSMDISERERLHGIKTFFAHDIAGALNWVPEVVRELHSPVYVTIDLDVFDPSLMPSTGTPEPGGLDWYAVMRLLKKVAHTKTILGFDVVELCPSADKAPDFIAAKLVYTLLSYIFAGK